MKILNIAIVEDESLVRKSLSAFLELQSEMQLGYSTTTVEDFLENGTSADILLLDINLPDGMSGLKGIRPLVEKFPKMEIIMLTAYEDSDRIFKALCAGAKGYISKRTSLADIKKAIVVVQSGGSYMSPAIARKVVDSFAPQPKKNKEELTPRQQQVVSGIVEGLSYKMVADKYQISLETVRDHIKKIYKKLHINSKAELISQWHKDRS